MARAFLFVLDSFGIGGAPDAEDFGDSGADTLGHIARFCVEERGHALKLPNMAALGLGLSAELASAHRPLPASALLPHSFHGAATEISKGKDTPSGHWEIAGLPVPFDWGYFPQTVPAFPASLVEALIDEADLSGILGDCHASGTEIIARLGAEHMETGKPILYTSADSVLQIAAHEQSFGLERLYELCAIARRLVDPLNIGRVIARPFMGDAASGFVRTGNRRDLAVPPPEPTLLDRIETAGGTVFAIGKIGDIFAQKGITVSRKASGNDAVWDEALSAMNEARDGDLVFANFVDFDMIFGHRRDAGGYAAALEAFDKRLPDAFAVLKPGDVLILTADHGCDPTWKGTDHTRERVPVLGLAPGLKGGSVGLRSCFSDIGETAAEHLGIAPGPYGRSFLEDIRA
jgi:phosphopentomutase